ncbi:MAG TPA: PilZ domain-containing protein [Sphingomicrobium sp.]|nr:PilZ domain-containing protein [Sphingomicrobium sp.]
MRPLTVAKRAPKRSRVFLMAELDSGHGPTAAHIRDISRSGALVESEVVPETGATVRLTCGDTTVTARVAWSERNWLGLEFYTPVVAGMLKDASGAQLKVSAPRTYHSGEALD